MRTLLAVTPHPDDEAYSFGGTIALASAAGWRCVVACATRGEGGERHDRWWSRPIPSGRKRAAELAAACRVLGAEAPRFLGFRDGGLRAGDPEGSARVAELLTELEPELVLALGADGAYGHPDHLAVCAWTREAVAGARTKPVLLFAAFPSDLIRPQYELCRAAGVLGEPPALGPEQLGVAQPHYGVPIADVAERKFAAIAAHRSQVPSGDPHRLFPQGIVAQLAAREGFLDESGAPSLETLAILQSVAPGVEPSR